MKQSSSIGFIGACLLATSVALVPMTLPASAQTNTTTPRTGTGGTTGTTTERTYNTTDNNDDNWGLWGLLGLTGLFGLMRGKRSHDDNRTTTLRDDATVYRDPSRR